jgi:hypothetical protein
MNGSTKVKRLGTENIGKLLLEMSSQISVLATCGIRPSDEAFENTSRRLSRLADSPENVHKDVYTQEGCVAKKS